MPQQRIQKILAAAGYGSRRSCEELVEEGRVTVNGKRIRELPFLVDPDNDHIKVDRKSIRPDRLVYFILNKPRGVYCTQKDPDGRLRAVDLLKGVKERIFPVGRLDADSMGLLIMTNDGELTQKLTHPRFQTPKTYRVETNGRPTEEALQKVRQGVWLSEGKTAPATITIVRRDRERGILEITLKEGRNREIRRMLARVGLKVRRLSRIRMGKISTKKLPIGAFRPLTKTEVNYLYSLAKSADEIPDPPPRRRKPRTSSAAARKRTDRKKTVKRGDADRKKSPRQAGAKKTSQKKKAGPTGAKKKRRLILPD